MSWNERLNLKTRSVSKREIIILSCRKFIVHTGKVWRCVKNANSSFNSKFNSKSNLVRNEELLPGNNACLIRYMCWILPFWSRIIKHSRSSKIPAVICRSLIWGLCSLVIFFDHQRALVYNRSDNSFWSSFLSWGHFGRTFYNFWWYIF